MTSIGPISIPLTADGLPDVLSAFNSMEKRYLSMEQKMAAITEENSKLLARLAKKDSDTKIKEEERAQREKEKLAAKEVKERDRINQVIHRDYQKRLAEQMKEEEKAANQEIALAEKVAKEEAAIAKKMEDIKTREAHKAARERLTIARNLSTGIINDLKSSMSFATNIFGGLLAIGGGAGIYSGLDQFLELDKQAMEFHHAAGVVGLQISPQEFKDKARAMGAEYNMSPTDAGKVYKTILDATGNAKMTTELAPLSTRLAYSEYADPVEVAKMLGQFAVQNPGMSAQQIRDIGAGAIRSTQYGSVEIPDLLKVAPAVTANAYKFAGSTQDNILKELVAVQIAKRASVSPEEAATALNRLPDDLVKHYKKIKSFGLEVFADQGHTKLKSLDVLIPDIMDKIGFNQEKIRQVFGERSGRFFNAFGQAYSQRREELKGTGLSDKEADKQAKQFAIQQFTDLFKDLGISVEQEDKSVAERRNSAEEKFKAVILDLKDKFTDLAPSILQVVDNLKPLIPILGDLLPKFGEWLVWASENPFSAIGELITASILKSIASASIGQVITTALTRSISGILGSGTLSIGSMALGGVATVTMAAAAVAITTAAIATSIAQNSIDTRELEGTRTLINNLRKKKQQGLSVSEQEDVDALKPIGLELQKNNLDPDVRKYLEAARDEFVKDAIDKLNNSNDNISKPESLTSNASDASKQGIELQSRMNDALQKLLSQGVKVIVDKDGHAVSIEVNRGSQGQLLPHPSNYADPTNKL